MGVAEGLALRKGGAGGGVGGDVGGGWAAAAEQLNEVVGQCDDYSRKMHLIEWLQRLHRRAAEPSSAKRLPLAARL
eukprot:1181653-Prorocentrum_minimum.AAC.4